MAILVLSAQVAAENGDSESNFLDQISTNIIVDISLLATSSYGVKDDSLEFTPSTLPAMIGPSMTSSSSSQLDSSNS